MALVLMFIEQLERQLFRIHGGGAIRGTLPAGSHHRPDSKLQRRVNAA